MPPFTAQTFVTITVDNVQYQIPPGLYSCLEIERILHAQGYNPGNQNSATVPFTLYSFTKTTGHTLYQPSPVNKGGGSTEILGGEVFTSNH